MEPYIQISKINDFLYCPRSLYLHTIYENFSESTFHKAPQVVGKINHKNIDDQKYSSLKHILQGIPVYSEKYNIAGKIDLYDVKKECLIERKTLIKKIWDGYKYQVYGQYFCLIEMGYKVKKICLHSLTNNKRYDIPLPNKSDIKNFKDLLEKIRTYNPLLDRTHSCPKCVNSIYGPLSW